jgi:hypothetical protein
LIIRSLIQNAISPFKVYASLNKMINSVTDNQILSYTSNVF